MDGSLLAPKRTDSFAGAIEHRRIRAKKMCTHSLVRKTDLVIRFQGPEIKFLRTEVFENALVWTGLKSIVYQISAPALQDLTLK